MIIESLEAENFLKYEQLSLASLPSEGVIAICGENESGKSTIGETLCFGLFGRTFSLDSDAPDKLIRWGASRCSVGVRFSVGDELGVYRLDRYLDLDGTFGARLEREHDGALLGRGIDSVDEAIIRLLGYGYPEFIESFYLAQRELTTPHPHSNTIKVMAGIAPLHEIDDRLERQIERQQNKLAASTHDLETTVEQREALDIDEGWLPELDSAHESAQQSALSLERFQSELGDSSHAYAEYGQSLQSSLRASDWLRQATIALVTISLISWLITAIGSGWIGQSVAEMLARRIDIASARTLSGVLSTVSVLCAAAWAILHLRSAPMRKQARRFPDFLENNPWGKVLPDFSERITELLSWHPAQPEVDRDSLLARSRKFQATAEEVDSAAQNLTQTASSAAMQLAKAAESLDFARRDEHSRLQLRDELLTAEKQLRDGLTEREHRLRVRSTARSLIEAASVHLSHDFNRSVLWHASKILPSLTRDRYRHLKIDDDLAVRVFSTTKGDFMDFNEISSGTQRQIMLALRLAMSQQLVTSIGGKQQFLFFDEPFAFFDQQRVIDTLAALPEFSPDIRQLWIVSQEFPPQVESDVMIRCQSEQSTLNYPMAD